MKFEKIIHMIENKGIESLGQNQIFKPQYLYNSML